MMKTGGSAQALGRLLLAVTVAVAAGCSKDSPAAPTPPESLPSTVPTTPEVLTILELDVPNRTARVGWSASAGAQAYTIAYDAVDGQRQMEVSATQTPNASLTDLRPDVPQSTISVTAKNAAGTSGPRVIEFHVPDFRYFVEALFLGSGPYGEGPHPAYERDRLNGWTPGNVRVRAHSSLEPRRNSLARFADQLSELTMGYLQGELVEVGDIRDEHVPGELRAFRSSRCQPPTAQGCAQFVFPRSPYYLQNPSNVYVVNESNYFALIHELGHALLGFQHVNVDGRWYPQVFRPFMAVGTRVQSDWVLGSSDGLTALEKEAVRRVYGAGLRPGATRADFAAHGLIH
jgi:hypothetical protein